MRIAYLDCFSGISGDMFLGALVDAGVPAKLLEETVAALKIGARIEIQRVVRGGIAATKVDVFDGDEKDLPREEFWEKQDSGEQGHSHEHEHSHGHEYSHSPEDKHSHKSLSHRLLPHDKHHLDPSPANADRAEKSVRATQAHSHSHEHAHLHEHTHGQSHDHDHAHDPAHPAHGRGLNEIKEIISAASISGTAKKTAIEIFEALGAAEAEIHNTSIEKVHFHEVGAVDAMVDIVCAAVGAEALGVDEWVCSSLNVGSGTVKCAHGTLPVPAPATLKLLGGAPVYSSGPQVELVTPTGAAIVKTLARRFAAFPGMKIEKAGYGAGSRNFADQPNVLRLTVGEPAEMPTKIEANPVPIETTLGGTSSDRIAVLEANLDDLNPQVLAYASEKLLAEGALDVFNVSVQMKKNRPGMLLTVLAKPEDADQLTKIVFAETTTLGVRRREEQRQVLARRWETVETSWGPVRMKIANLNGTVANYAPEYEDCRRIAAEHHVPLKAVMQEAVRLYAKVAAPSHTR